MVKIIKKLNRSGVIRIIELLIAITIISGILIIAYRDSRPTQDTQDLSEIARDILAEISNKEELRVEIIQNQLNTANMVMTKNFINDSLADYINFEFRSCKLTSACGQSSYVGNVFSAERIISSSKENFNPVKIRLFLWVPQ